ncbi:hypothetical protein Dda_7168 [Drechslerella dactyloides]|uniref:Uncharacterized protein n=1 Tax=Drechslerella dactyloides TaxID=74499 RepID=A0AAD6NHA2_DREDA|nr:hypothetical protein Dda_7168 [Drechslerella dactyloides]
MSEPTYDKAHYAYQKPASRATHSLLNDDNTEENTTEPAPAPLDDDREPADHFHQPGPNAASDAEWDTAQYHLDSHPGEHRRSTYNYQKYHEEFKNKSAEDGTQEDDNTANEPEEAPAGRRGSVTSQPFKPVARTQSFNIRDMRGEAQSALIDDGDDASHNYSRA